MSTLQEVCNEFAVKIVKMTEYYSAIFKTTGELERGKIKTDKFRAALQLEGVEGEKAAIEPTLKIIFYDPECYVEVEATVCLSLTKDPHDLVDIEVASRESFRIDSLEELAYAAEFLTQVTHVINSVFEDKTGFDVFGSSILR